MMWEAETRARIEEAFEVIEDCLNKLTCSPTLPFMGTYFDACIVHFDDLEFEYYKTLAIIDKEEARKR